jgi:predicted RNase H-like HicB family nuclease
MTRPLYTIHARRDGAWWTLDVPELRGVYSQSKRLDQAEDAIREVIEGVYDRAPDTYDLTVKVDDPVIAELIDAQATMWAQLDEMIETFRVQQRATVEKLRSDMKFPMRDVGRLLDVSHQRVAQIVAETQDRVSKVVADSTKDIRDRTDAHVRGAIESIRDATRSRDKV